MKIIERGPRLWVSLICLAIICIFVGGSQSVYAQSNMQEAPHTSLERSVSDKHVEKRPSFAASLSRLGIFEISKQSKFQAAATPEATSTSTATIVEATATSQ